MWRVMRYVTAMLIVLFVGYALSLAAAYGIDKQECAEHGETNTITPTFRGYCVKSLSDGSLELRPVENYPIR